MLLRNGSGTLVPPNATRVALAALASSVMPLLTLTTPAAMAVPMLVASLLKLVVAVVMADPLCCPIECSMSLDFCSTSAADAVRSRRHDARIAAISAVAFFFIGPVPVRWMPCSAVITAADLSATLPRVSSSAA